jgi:hypothetical protein
MPDKNVIKGSSLTGSLLPALAIAGAGYLLYKKAGDLSNGLSGIGGSGSSFYESIKETVKETAGANSEDPATVYNLLLNPEMLPESQNQEIYADNPNTDYQSSTGTAGEWSDFLTKGPIGAGFNVISEIGTAINPMPEDLKAQQQLLGSGNFTAQDAADPNSLFAKLFGGASKSSYASKAGEVQSVNVSDIKTHEQAVSMGLGNAPLAVNNAPLPVNVNAPLAVNVNNVANKPTNKRVAQKVKSSGMPASNLKNASSVSTSKDSSGKERIVVKYKNGVTLRY